MHIVFRTTRLVCGAVASVAFLVSCTAPPESVPQPATKESTATNKWEYAAYLLSRGEAVQARAYLEPLSDAGQVDVSDPALLWRDLAEARLFSSDLVGAETAAHRARQELAREPNTAQFNADDRYLFQRTIDALEAAANADEPRLATLADDEQFAPSADAWYLLGWLDELHGNQAAARTAYLAYLDRAPQWTFLRQAFEMRRHAQLVAR